MRAWFLAVVAALVAACATAPQTPSTGAVYSLPDPLSGPGAPDPDRRERKILVRGSARLASGDPDGALEAALRAASTPAGPLLALQARLEASGHVEQVIDELDGLLGSNPRYAAAWATLTQALERKDDRPRALAAARRTAELWPRSTWGRRAAELQDRWIDDRLTEAGKAVAGDPERALADARAVLELAPGMEPARLIEAQALFALERDREALAVLAGLGRAADAILLEARIAERRGDLATAMERYAALPPDYPGREAELARARLAWRVGNAPAYVAAALASPHLNRGELAAVLVTAIPRLVGIDDGEVPLLTDIVDLPMRNEVLVVVRAGVLTADPVERRFNPQLRVTTAEVGDALDAVAHLLGLTVPVWCGEGTGTENGSGCVALPDPPDGRTVADLAIAIQGRMSR